MKTFDLAVSRKKRHNHIVNLIVLTILYFVGYWIGQYYDQGRSPYSVAYLLPSLVTGLVCCKRFSDKVSAYLHPYTKKRVTVYNYGNDYDPAMGVVGILLVYAFYALVGCVIFPVYFIWAVVVVVRTTTAIYRNQRAGYGMMEEVNC